MAVITEGLKGLNPFAPEFFPNPNQKPLSLSGTTGAPLPLIPYYTPPLQPIYPNQYYSSFLHQISATSATTTPSHNYSNNPFPAHITQLASHNLVQPSTEPTRPQVPHEEQQLQHHGHDGVHNRTAMTAPRPPRIRSSIIAGNKKSSEYEMKRRDEVKPRLGFGNYKEVLPVKHDGNNTTVMIRNIPNKYNRDQLMDFVDNHCAVENKKAEVVGEGGGDNSALVSAYDFLYMPIDFQTGCNKGYAFVNFTNPQTVWKFYLAADSQTWDNFKSAKIREIAYAKIQGKEELVRHFETTGFPCASEDVLPVCFDPPRDGSRMRVLHTTVGKPTLRKLSDMTN